MPPFSLRRILSTLRPGPAVLRGGALGVLLAGILAYLSFAARLALGPLPVGAGVLLFFVLLGLPLLFLGQGIAKLLDLFQRLPWRPRWMLLAALPPFFIALMNFGQTAQALLIAYSALVGLLLGGAIASLSGASLRGGSLQAAPWACRPLGQRLVTAASLALGALALTGGLGWGLLYHGQPAKAILDSASRASGPAPAPLTLPDPSQPGPYSVLTSAYGSGSDRYRPEYGEKADLRTPLVDGSRLLRGSWEGPFSLLRQAIWGVDPAHLPLNARVWAPRPLRAGETFPLVLIAHGNHHALDFSEAGYAYLGELLASRGYLVAALDMNFLNDMPTDLAGGINGENDARAWLMLEHLRQWRAWNADPGSPFYGQVDLEHIALIGHSRGGEAAAIAAAFNRLPALPEDALQTFDYHFAIRSVIAIAPIDGQYNPAQRPTALSNLNYLVLQGSHDADLTSFSGIQQYERVRFVDAPPGAFFKSALYIYRANHGQFNTIWGSDDVGALRSFFINTAALLPGADQRQIAKVYISAFLEATLRGQSGYRALFADPRAAGPGWLPGALTINRYDQPGDQLIAGYEEDADLQSATLPGSSITARGFAAWREQRQPSKWGSASNSLVSLAWDEAAAPVYAIHLPGADLASGPGASLLFNLADALQDPPAKGSSTAETRPLDLTIELEDASGVTAALPLSRWRPVQPQFEAQLYKAAVFERTRPSEPVLQSYALPLADFVAANPLFDPTRLAVLRFVFNRSPRGSLLLDGVGVRP